MATLRKRTVFYPCPAHVSRYACETRQRRAECFVEGGWPSPCTAGERCTMKPGTDFYAPEFVAEHDVFTVEPWTPPDNRTAAQVYADAWAYVVETLNPRSTAHTANGRDLEAYELRMRRGARPDYDVIDARATSSMDAAHDQAFAIMARQPVYLLNVAASISDAIHALPAIGGEVALPDGFVVRVRRVNRYVLAGDVAKASGEPCRVGDAIDRFNALQED